MCYKLRRDRVLAAVLILILTAAISATEVELAPYGPAPLLNGLMGEAEWQKPAAMERGWDRGSIWIKQDSQFVYLCVAPKDTSHTGLNLYIDNMDGAVFMLHVSAAHGQRLLHDSAWEEMTWGPAEYWTSNLIQMLVESGTTVFLAPEAFEFQIDRKLLPAETMKIMMHLKRPDEWVPADADTLSSDNWPQYRLDRPIGER
jgi:hypothetical protein